MKKDVMKAIEEYIRFMRIREYATLVICGDFAKESAIKHLGMPLEKFESWLDTWKFIRDCVDEGQEDYEKSLR